MLLAGSSWWTCARGRVSAAGCLRKRKSTLDRAAKGEGYSPYVDGQGERDHQRPHDGVESSQGGAAAPSDAASVQSLLGPSLLSLSLSCARGDATLTTCCVRLRRLVRVVSRTTAAPSWPSAARRSPSSPQTRARRQATRSRRATRGSCTSSPTRPSWASSASRPTAPLWPSASSSSSRCVVDTVSQGGTLWGGN